MFTAWKNFRMSTLIGAAPEMKNTHWSRPSAARSGANICSSAGGRRPGRVHDGGGVLGVGPRAAVVVLAGMVGVVGAAAFAEGRERQHEPVGGLGVVIDHDRVPQRGQLGPL